MLVNLKNCVPFSTIQARHIVRTILRPHGDLGLDTQTIYKAAMEKFPDAVRIRPDGTPSNSVEPSPTELSDIRHPNHPIRSMVYLKRTVLEDMAKRKQVEKVRFKRGTVIENGVRMDIETCPSKQKRYRPQVSILDMPGVNEAWRWRIRDDAIEEDPERAREEEKQLHAEFERKYGSGVKRLARLKAQSSILKDF